MPIYNSPNATIALKAPPTTSDLPLNVVLNYLDPASPDWDLLFRGFAGFVYDCGPNPTAPTSPNLRSGLSSLIFQGWLKHMVQISASGDCTYIDPITVTNRATLFTALNNLLTSKPECELFMLIGLYHFVIWLLSNKGDAGFVKSMVTDYIKQEIVSYEYEDLNRNYNIKWRPSNDFPSTFERAFGPKNSLLQFVSELQNIRPYLMFTKESAPLPAFALASAQQRTAIKAAMYSFIKEARRLLETVVHHEVLSVLREIRPALAEHYVRMSIMAAGLGQDTHGFFGIRSFGILFFNYELLGSSSDSDFGNPLDPDSGVDAIKYLGVANERSWKGKDISSLFVSHVGIDKPFQLAYDANVGRPERRKKLIPHIELERWDLDGSSEQAVLYAVKNEGYSFASDAPADLYNKTTGTIPLSEFQSVELKLATNKSVVVPGGDLGTGTLEPSTVTQEELAFFLFPNTIDRTTASASASTSWLLEDNEFWKDIATINQEVFRPEGSVDPDLDAVIAELVFGPDFTVSAELRGEGVGTLLDGAEITADGPTVTRDSDQHDRPVPNATSNNNLLRYAHGTMAYSGSVVGGTLEFDVVAFTSPVHCTWETKLQSYPLMLSEVGQWLELDQGRIWYNGALSAFRAFGFFQAMIEAVKNRINELSLPGSDLNIAAPQIRQKLDDYLNNTALVQIRTQSGDPVKKGLPPDQVELVVDHALFNRFVQ